MAGGRGPGPCGRDGCLGAGVAPASAAVAGPPWVPRARWLARRLAALLVLLALVAAGCALRRRACPEPRRPRPPPRRAPPAAPGTGGTAGPPAARMGLELPHLPSYEEVKHLPSYEEAQRCPPAERGAAAGMRG